MKILLIADVHNKNKGGYITRMKLKKVVKSTPCDLIVFLGDTVHGPDIKSNYEKYLRQVLDLTGDKPFATVFGNHDDECYYSKEEYIKVCQSYKNCLTKGKNYVLEIDGETLLFMDSGSYYPTDESLYDTVKQEEIDKAIEQIKGKRAILFQHIIPPNIMDLVEVFNKREKGTVRDGKRYCRFKADVKYTGRLGEMPCPPDISTGQLEQLSPYLKCACFGHDHKNSFELELLGVKLIQCAGCGYNSYDKLCRSSVKLLDTKTLEAKQIFI